MQQRGMMTMAFFVVASEERRKDFLMKAAVIHASGQPPRFEDFPEPTSGEGEVGVNVRAAGLHPFVRAQASGSQSGNTNIFPQIPGIDGVGSLDDGTRVYFDKARPPYGTMAERCVVLNQQEGVLDESSRYPCLWATATL